MQGRKNHGKIVYRGQSCSENLWIRVSTHYRRLRSLMKAIKIKVQISASYMRGGREYLVDGTRPMSASIRVPTTQAIHRQYRRKTNNDLADPDRYVRVELAPIRGQTSEERWLRIQNDMLCVPSIFQSTGATTQSCALISAFELGIAT